MVKMFDDRVVQDWGLSGKELDENRAEILALEALRMPSIAFADRKAAVVKALWALCGKYFEWIPDPDRREARWPDDPDVVTRECRRAIADAYGAIRALERIAHLPTEPGHTGDVLAQEPVPDVLVRRATSAGSDLAAGEPAATDRLLQIAVVLDEYLRETEPNPTTGGESADMPPGAENRRPTSQTHNAGYCVADLREMVGLKNSALNRYAKAANVTRPGRGQRNFRYAATDVRAILQTIVCNASEAALLKRCATALQNLPKIAE